MRQYILRHGKSCDISFRIPRNDSCQKIKNKRVSQLADSIFVCYNRFFVSADDVISGNADYSLLKP